MEKKPVLVILREKLFMENVNEKGGQLYKKWCVTCQRLVETKKVESDKGKEEEKCSLCDSSIISPKPISGWNRV